MGTEYAVFAGRLRHYDEDALDRLAVLDEALLRRRFDALGADLVDGEDEGSWSLPTAVYDINLLRGEDGRCRVVVGELGLDADAREEDVRTVLTGLHQLARASGAKLWHCFGEGGYRVTARRLEREVRA
ncbi:hypothetical protein [Kineococcus radiotolerans]|uniref:Uncharacterized protein n=1 Tax=Kineococcus radiotolerans (strain ATCC BAA-149 / DSM 14245 / SRS30216) TaxID=266940 RepID=A6WBX2_KINRD|nr:hypothetical protein [Kineococcus radiotolerans]ABS04311.1 hypothetical protein Krad_2843 [Kineococcus radiotolerans SRS30216 = ATCC BAA-149]